MVQKFVFKLLMSPFALLYGLGVGLHNGLYKLGVLRGLDFNLPVISVGNMTVGGSGKTPHIEYLVETLKPYLKIAILSRGYRRKSKGMIYVSPHHDAYEVGDEPLQYKRKFPDTSIIVSESRAFAIPKMVANQPDTQVILMDDAYQHRAVNPGLNILLTEYDLPFFDDYLLPMGRLREWRSAYKRADVIIVSKCPDELSPSEQDAFIQRLNPRSDQPVFFSKYRYQYPHFLFNPSYKIKLTSDMHVILLCALARTEYLVRYIASQVDAYDTIEYEDHHYYNSEDIQKVHNRWSQLDGEKKIILTTEKDATRLELLYPQIKDLKLPIYILPIDVEFIGSGEVEFNQLLQEYLLSFEV